LIDFHVQCDSANLALLGDEVLLPRLLSILLENAAKFTPPGGAVTLLAKAEGNRVNLSVTDTGIGIPPEYQTKIFDRFYRVAAAKATAPAGSGLGLALGSWIADRHGTELCVVSKPGHGSCFSFSLERAESVVSVNRAPVEQSDAALH
jgi:signal transduction histidine kinase